MKKVEYTIIDYRELEKKIQEHFSRPEYNIVADNEWNNDGEHSFELDGEVSFPSGVDEFKAGRGFMAFGVSDLLNQMVVDGVLEPGNYLVEVCW